MSDTTTEDTLQYGSDDTALQYSPFSAEEAPGIQLVVLMRIYDVLMAMYTDMDKDGAAQLMELHTQGAILGSLPFFDPSLLQE